MAALSKPWNYGRSLARIAGSNPAGGRMAVSLKCCLFSDASATGRTRVLPSVCGCACVCVNVCVCACVSVYVNVCV